jgi:hypothetical protein
MAHIYQQTLEAGATLIFWYVLKLFQQFGVVVLVVAARASEAGRVYARSAFEGIHL